MGIRRLVTMFMFGLLAGGSVIAADQVVSPLETRGEDLARQFQSPPDSAKPWAYWFWVNGNITREGITADLESMARVGIKAVLIMETSCAIPEGTVKFLSPQWRELFKHTLAEANRLGMQVDMNNDAGWCGSGGPWNTPEHSMQRLVSSRTRVEGGRKIDQALPTPPAVNGFYRDIELLAIPQSAGAPSEYKLTTVFGDTTLAQDGRADTRWISRGMPTPETPEFLRFDYTQAWPAGGLYLLSSPEGAAKEIEIQCSDDGKSYRTIQKATVPQATNAQPQELRLAFAETRSSHFRVLFNSTYPSAGKMSARVHVAEIALLAAKDLATGTALTGRRWDSAQAVDLSARMDASGRLQWDAPPGCWEILRIGHASTGKGNHPAPASGCGLECDRLSKEALEAHFNGMMAKLIEDAGPLAGKVLSHTHIDSWESGTQNWTPKFREEFQRLRGYDPLPYLPGELGYILDNPGIQRRFQWDMRMTVNDLLVENYAGHLQKLANQRGLGLSIEAYMNTPCIEQAYAGRADMPMGEFWVRGKTNPDYAKIVWTCREMASASHLYGKPITGAEAFTAVPDQARWQHHPASLKSTGDEAFCEGINRFMLSCVTHQPWLNRAPGMTMGAWGAHFGRTETWWDHSTAWLQYLSRCQYLLQTGLYAADICYLDVEASPRRAPYRIGLPGYEYDVCPAEVVRTRMSVRDGRIVLPDGMNYRLLVLPPTEKMTPETLRKIVELAKAGATIAATTVPSESPSLQNHPQCDADVKAMARELFGDATTAPASGVKESKCGAGRVFLAQNIAPILKAIGVSPDLTFTGDAKLRWIHRQTADSELYFISNQADDNATSRVTFRITGRQPELWQPETGQIRDLPEYTDENGCTTVPLRFGPSESYFVVFRKKAPNQQAKSGGATGKNFPEFKPAQELSGSWQVQFDPQRGGPAKPVTFDSLIDWSRHAEAGIKYFSGTAIYRKEFQAHITARASKIHLDLGRVEAIAEVTLNGKLLGTLWKPPFRIDVTSHLNPGRNTLEVRVVNLWWNRLVGDQQLAEDATWRKGDNFSGLGQYVLLKNWPAWLLEGKPSPTGRFTFSTAGYHKKDDPLLSSGLLGPVRIVTEE